MRGFLPAALLLITAFAVRPTVPAFAQAQGPGDRSADNRFNVVGATIAETQQAIREGRTTCRAVVQSYLARISFYDQKPMDGPGGNQRLNSIVLVNPNALADADDCDHNFAATHTLPPLGGIAVLIKDNYDTMGLQTTGGSLAMKGFLPERDATMVARLRAAGAIILAKTNMAEWAFSPYLTASSIAGITRNPYDLTRVPAGSSGGTAAAVASSLGESGLGTDTGNSIRGPSSHNDLVGIRPTIGLTSRSGIIPLFANNDVGGPIARTVADAAALLTVVAKPDSADPITWHSTRRPKLGYTQFLDRHGLRGARIGVFRQYFDKPETDPEVKAVTEQALKTLQQEGAVLVDPFTIPGYDDLTKNLWCGDFEADLNAYLAKHPNAPYHDLKSIVASGLYLPYIEEEIKGAVAPPKADDRRAPCPDVYHDAPKIAFRNALMAAMAKDHLDAIVYPTWSNAPRKVGDTESPAGDNSQVLSPQTGFPAITVPMGFTHGALPAGLTILGPAFSEAKLIRYAYDFEQTTQQRRDPPLFPPLP
ncbi:Asp-tRNA(Asn)/Glu-tRNA(Gln) amidotransferase A subunit family amidase [Silvibacterium bohemicum]|uniref:Asp-tRNA(Asn)/Glu-tRNA(Gln) amidotransferase A subunit family amidase n=1 Tax=Silvibacterium bohemicum TaxID=1577686 RepID=A0A841JWI5_9BACT|nr:amidase family protein [Silvibacterium bohemicum]MBB6142364.1 Asp-tRNA(Asn)/Glu-tRNA(Gln) amidotransferase A subunit family amidase [Silvibacterium bohemicum]